MELSARQREILETALALLAEGGPANLTIKNLAARVGVTEPAIYRHYSCKRAILLSMLETFREIADEALTAIEREDGPALTKVLLFARDRLRRCVENPNLAKVMFSEEFFQDDPFLAMKTLDLMKEHHRRLTPILETGRRRGEVRDDIGLDALFRLAFGPVRLIIKQWCLSGQTFDLLAEGEVLLEALGRVLKKASE